MIQHHSPTKYRFRHGVLQSAYRSNQSRQQNVEPIKVKMLMRRPKSSRLLSKRNSQDDGDVVQSSTTSLAKSNNDKKDKYFETDHSQCCRRSQQWKISLLQERWEAADTGPGQSGDQRQVRGVGGAEGAGAQTTGGVDIRQERYRAQSVSPATISPPQENSAVFT